MKLVIDIDVTDENEDKSLVKNIKTVNKSGSGIHLHTEEDYKKLIESEGKE